MCFLPCFLHKQKTSRPPGRDRAPCAACGTPLKKARCCAAAQKEPPPRTGPGIPVPPAAYLLKRQGAAQLHKKSHYPGRDRASCAACGTLLKKVRYCTAVHLPPSPGGEGFFKGHCPLNALLVPFRASEKGPAAGAAPRIRRRQNVAAARRQADILVCGYACLPVELLQ